MLRKNRVVLILLLVSLFCVIIGITYAYFSANIIGAESASVLTLESGKLFINLEGGSEIIAENLFPHDEAWAEKTFTLTGTNTTDNDMPYSVNIVVDNNTFSTDAITYSLIGENISNNGNVIKDIKYAPINNTSTIGTGYFLKGNNVVHTYTLKFYFLNQDSDQSDDMKKVFNAHITITGGKSSPQEDILAEATDVYTLLKNKTYSNQDGVWFFDENGDLDYGDNTKINLNLTNNIPKGVVSIWNNTPIYICLNYNNYNYEYDLVKKNLQTRNMPCITDRYQNLVINGNLEYKSNMNLTGFGTYNQDGYLSLTTSSTVDSFSTFYIPVNPNKKYEIGIEMKSSNTKADYYVGFNEYDVDQKWILSSTVSYLSNTLTELVQDLNPGDKIIYFKNLTNWNDTTSLYYQKGFVFWNYKDSTGYEYPELTYSQNHYSKREPALYENSAVDKTNNTITLTSDLGWTGPEIPKGTKVSQSSDGSTYNYSVAGDKKITTTWEKYSSNSYIYGTAVSSSTSNYLYNFRPGTRYIRFFIRYNYNLTPNTTTDIKNIYIKEVKE